MSERTKLKFWRTTFLACAIMASPMVANAQEKPVPTVTVQQAKLGDYTIKTRLPGRIKASTEAEVRPQVTGIIHERLFEEGSLVKIGQPLYKIEDETYAAAVLSAKAAVAEATANRDLANLEARRAELLLESRTGSVSARDKTMAEKSKAEAALQMAQAQLKTAEIDLDRTTIRAPITGIVGLTQTTPGALVAAQQVSTLTTIRTLDPVYVDVTQSATDLLRWNKTGQNASHGDNTVSMILPDGSVYPVTGNLRAAEPKVEPTTGMVTLRINFANPDFKLLPGLYVEVEMAQAKASNTVAVPQSSVMRLPNGDAYVFLVVDGKVAKKDIKIIANEGNQWIVGDGLKDGDAIITSGFQKIAPGAPVQIVDEAAAKPAATEEGK